MQSAELEDYYYIHGLPNTFEGNHMGDTNHNYGQPWMARLLESSPSDRSVAMQRIEELTEELRVLRASVSRREADAYEHGLADRAEVLRQNKILSATIAALTNRQHELNVQP